MDPQTTASILELLKEINHKFGITIVIIITHQMSVVRKVCSHVAIMKAGEVIELEVYLKYSVIPNLQWQENCSDRMKVMEIQKDRFKVEKGQELYFLKTRHFNRLLQI